MLVPVDRASARLWAGLATPVILASLFGCGAKNSEQPPPPPAEAPAPEPAPVAAAPPVDPNAAADKKIDMYSSCFNATNKPAYQAMSRYNSWVSSMRIGPTGSERIVNGVGAVPDDGLVECGVPLMDAANAVPSLNDLDTVAKIYSMAVTDWGKSLKEAGRYYRSAAYKEDAMAQGMAMHRGLVKNYETFVRASGEFGQALDDANDQRQQEQLSALETTEGRTYNYWRIATMRSARRLVSVLRQDRFVITEATARLKAYEENAERMTATAQLPEADTPAPLRAVEDYRTASQQRLSRVFKKKPYTDSEQVRLNTDSKSASSVDGSPASVIRSYNILVGESNAPR